MNNDNGIPAAAGDEGFEKKPAPRQMLQIPPRDSISSLQIGTVLNALGLTASLLRSLSDLDEDDDSPARQKMSGECKLALETSVIKTCSRLDSLLEDQKRWSIREQDTLEGAQRRVLKQQMDFSKAQTALSKSINTPHYERRPQLARAGDDLWLAIEGDPNDLVSCIVGVGRSPQQAVDAFDHFFLTGNHTDLTSQFMQVYLAKKEEITPEQPKYAEPIRPFEDADATTELPKRPKHK
jgi:hypothetical protein